MIRRPILLLVTDSEKWADQLYRFCPLLNIIDFRGTLDARFIDVLGSPESLKIVEEHELTHACHSGSHPSVKFDVLVRCILHYLPKVTTRQLYASSQRLSDLQWSCTFVSLESLEVGRYFEIFTTGQTLSCQIIP
jgi:hypothetical protein